MVLQDQSRMSILFYTIYFAHFYTINEYGLPKGGLGYEGPVAGGVSLEPSDIF